MKRLTALFAFALVSSLSGGVVQQAQADDRVWRTSTTLIGPSKYAEEFKHFDYVNPNAPKGGTLNRAVFGTFDSFNPFIVKGSPAAGVTYQGGLLWENLMDKGLDEPASSHPLIAEAFTYPDDYSSATYRLNPNARWHDGKSITVEDVKWSMTTLKEHSAQYNRYFGDVKEVRIDNDREITFVFSEKGNRELPIIIGDLPVLPKHWWEGTDAKGNKRDFTRSTLEPPLGSGPYKISDFSAGSSIIWERVDDHWGKNLPVNIGRHNIGRYKYQYFGDRNAMWEAFKKGGLSDYRRENQSKRWATEYTFSAFKDGDVRKVEFPSTGGYIVNMFQMNSRRKLFKDRRVRKALVWALNFEQMNEDLFFSLYSRSTSYFGGTELAATGLPSAEELKILEPYRGKIPDEVFTDEFSVPQYKSRRDRRKHLGTALGLLKEAGWVQKNSKLVNGVTGAPFKFEILASSPSAERTWSPWINSLRLLGIEAQLRIVDPSQYIQRVTNFEFDVVGVPSQQSVSPGNEQREYWTSKSANQPGSRNYIGASNEAIDALVEQIIFAKDRQTLIYTTRALERILQFEYYAVPAWYSAKEWYALWDHIQITKKQPEYYGFDPFSWWIDPDKEAALKAKYN